MELKEVSKYFKKLEENARVMLLDAFAEDITKNAIEFAKPHHDTGTMENNIDWGKKDKNTAIVGIRDDGMMVEWRGKRVNYAVFVLLGTKAHIIKPKNKKALRFSYKNLDEFVFRKKVHHPGYKGDDFLQKALQKSGKNIGKIFKRIDIDPE